jgi:hypothetical protein
MAVPASAEWFVDAYGGYSRTGETDVEVTGSSDLSIGPVTVGDVPFRAQLFDVETADSFLAGIRAGYWLDPVPAIGIAIDVFYFEPTIRDQTVQALTTTDVVIPEIFDQSLTIGIGAPVSLSEDDVPAVIVSPDVRLRWRLWPDKMAPQGRFQPYLMAGPAWLLTDVEDYDTSLGVKVGAGVV